MSVEAMSIALHHSRATGAARLVLIGIANHDGDGGAWPSVQSLQKYAGGIDRRNVQRALQRLEELHEIKRIIGQGGDHSTADHRRPNLYRFLLECPADCDRSKNHRTRRDSELMLPIALDGAANAPRAASAPRGGRSAASGGGASAAQTKQVNHLHLVKDSATDARADEVDDAPQRAGVLRVASSQDYEHELRSKCPMRAGHTHRPGIAVCRWCGIREDQYWRGKDIITDPDWRTS